MVILPFSVSQRWRRSAALAVGNTKAFYRIFYFGSDVS
jgi:hypothetical protein